jgi:hypothetical protein
MSVSLCRRRASNGRPVATFKVKINKLTIRHTYANGLEIIIIITINRKKKGQRFSNDNEEIRNHTEATQNAATHIPPNVAAEQENGKK